MNVGLPELSEKSYGFSQTTFFKNVGLPDSGRPTFILKVS